MLSLTLEALVMFFADEGFEWRTDGAQGTLRSRIAPIIQELADPDHAGHDGGNAIVLIDSDGNQDPQRIANASTVAFVSSSFPPAFQLGPEVGSRVNYSLDLKLLVDAGTQMHALIVSTDNHVIARLRNLALIRNRASRRPSGSIDLSTGIAAQNVYQPEPFGGFVMRWIGPEPNFILNLDRHLLAQSREFAISFEITVFSALPPACLNYLTVRHNERIIPHLVIKKGQFHTVLFRLESYPATGLGQLSLTAPLTVSGFPEAFNPASRLFSLGLLSIEFFAEERGQTATVARASAGSLYPESMKKAIGHLQERAKWEPKKFGDLTISGVKSDTYKSRPVSAVAGAVWRDIFLPQIIWRPAKTGDITMLIIRALSWAKGKPEVRSIISAIENGRPKRPVASSVRTGSREQARPEDEALIKDVVKMIGA